MTHIKLFHIKRYWYYYSDEWHRFENDDQHFLCILLGQSADYILILSHTETTALINETSSTCSTLIHVWGFPLLHSDFISLALSVRARQPYVPVLWLESKKYEMIIFEPIIEAFIQPGEDLKHNESREKRKSSVTCHLIVLIVPWTTYYIKVMWLICC